jgi:hypothetical protein
MYPIIYKLLSFGESFQTCWLIIVTWGLHFTFAKADRPIPYKQVKKNVVALIDIDCLVYFNNEY